MNKKALLIIISILAAFGIGVFFWKFQKPEKIASRDMLAEKTQTESSTYVTYTSEILNSSSAKRRVLFFYANWCPTCASANKNFMENKSQIPEDVILIRVNYNDSDTDQSEKDLAKKYSIGYQHTFVQIDSDGKQIALWNGGETSELLDNLK